MWNSDGMHEHQHNNSVGSAPRGDIFFKPLWEYIRDWRDYSQVSAALELFYYLKRLFSKLYDSVNILEFTELFPDLHSSGNI